MDWQPQGINAITLFVGDVAEAKRFYQEVFGLSVVFEDDASAVFRFGDILVNLLDESQAPELVEPAPVAPCDAGSRAVFTIQVEDVDATCAELTSRGAVLLNGPIERPWGVRTAAFADPGGHVWEIAH